MNTFLATTEIVIFSSLSILHFYWAFGGKWALENAAPSTKSGQKTINPGFFATLVVAFGLLLFAGNYVLKLGTWAFPFSEWITNYAGWIISAIFIVRAIGEFNYVGFFKKVKDTEFARLDTKIYSPISLTIGVIGVLLEILG